MNLTGKVESFIQQHFLIPGNSRILAAVSGGPDSLCLLHCLSEIKKKFSFILGVAHLDHGLRTGSDQDEAFVCDLCASMDIPYFSERIEPGIMVTKGSSPEETARDFRLNYLEKVRTQEGYDRIALGHNRDDQIETFLMRLFSGTGLEGLSGMRPRRDCLIRPLLDCSRLEILGWLKEKDIQFCVDETNQDTRFRRNFIRQKVRPLLQEQYQNHGSSLIRLMDIITQENDWFKEKTEDFFEKFSTRNGEAVHLQRKEFMRLPEAMKRRILKKVILEPNYGVIKEIISKCIMTERRNHTVLRDSRLQVRLRGREIIFSSPLPSIQPYELLVSEPGTVSLPGSGCVLDFSEVSVPEASALHDQSCLWMDLEKVSWPIQIRSRKQGDRVRFSGKGRGKRLKKMLIDLKIPVQERNLVPVFLSGSKIAAVFFNLAKRESVNYISSGFRIYSLTRKVLRIRVIRLEDPWM